MDLMFLTKGASGGRSGDNEVSDDELLSQSAVQRVLDATQLY